MANIRKEGFGRLFVLGGLALVKPTARSHANASELDARAENTEDRVLPLGPVPEAREVGQTRSLRTGLHPGAGSGTDVPGETRIGAE